VYVLLPTTPERLHLIEHYGITPAVAELYVREHYRGTIEEARTAALRQPHNEYWSAMARIALGTEIRLLEEVIPEVRRDIARHNHDSQMQKWAYAEATGLSVWRYDSRQETESPLTDAYKQTLRTRSRHLNTVFGPRVVLRGVPGKQDKDPHTATLHERYGISPAVADVYLEKNGHGSSREITKRRAARATAYDPNYTGWLAAIEEIAQGDQPSYLLEEVMQHIQKKRELAKVRNRQIGEVMLRDISLMIRKVYEPQVTAQNGRVRS
jgi:hypothetical protein